MVKAETDKLGSAMREDLDAVGTTQADITEILEAYRF